MWFALGGVVCSLHQWGVACSESSGVWLAPMPIQSNRVGLGLALLLVLLTVAKCGLLLGVWFVLCISGVWLVLNHLGCGLLSASSEGVAVKV